MIEFQDSVLAGTILVRSAVQSPNYVAGVSGWTINQDGSVEFTNGTFRGSLVAGSIDIQTTWAGGNRYQINSSDGFLISNAAEPNQTNRITRIGMVLSPQDPTTLGNTVGITSTIACNTNGVAPEYPYLIIDSPSLGLREALRIQLRGQTADGSVPETFIVKGYNSTTNYMTVTAAEVASTSTFKAGPNATDLGRGILVNAESNVTSGTVGIAEVVILTTASATFRAGRAYKVRCFARYNQGTAAANNLIIGVRKTNLAGASLANIARFLQLPAATTTFSGYWECKFTVGGADVTAAIAITMTGSAANNAVQQAGRSVEIEDIGPASMYTVEPVIV